MGSHLSLFTFGQFQAKVGNRPLQGLSDGKMSALLVYLAVYPGRKHRRDELAELLWPNLEAGQARANLRHTFFHLRRVLEGDADTPPVLLSGREWLGFNPDCDYWIDALALTSPLPSCSVELPSRQNCASCLEQIEQRVALYSGVFMAGLLLPDCPDFELWLGIQRETLLRHAFSLLEKLADCNEQMGDYGRSLQYAARQTEIEPLDEAAHRRMMSLYALNGQENTALHQYEICCRVLKNELGVLPSEETRQLAEQIRNSSAQRLKSAAANLALQFAPLAPAERRQVTVLYCELNTPADDPDEAMELLHVPQARCAEIIRQHAGHIVQAYGGGLLAYFGYPQADEHAAQHGVQAALSVVSQNIPGIEIRAGVHTGFVISGDTLADTPGIASRIAMQLRLYAAPGEAAISSTTHQLVSGYFEWANLGWQPLPGSAQPQEIFRVARKTNAHSRLDAVGQLTPLAGRKRELAQLQRVWKSAVQGMKQVVLLQGEAGIGKSRLLHSLKEQLRDTPHALRELRCFPESSHSPFNPLISMLEATFGFAQDDTAETKSALLVHYLESHYPGLAQKSVPLLAQLLSLPQPDNYSPPALPPQQQKEQTIAVLLDIVHALAAQQPLLLILEDLHWIDPSTLELLGAYVSQNRSAPVLALLTTRPEFTPPWNPEQYRELALQPLSEEEVMAIVRSIDADIPPATVRQIAKRSDGVPLFAEEMTRFAASGGPANIPATLRDLLATRMDTLGRAKQTAQLAAAIGREFGLELLGRVSSAASPLLSQDLDTLLVTGLVSAVNDATLQFKHALIQEAAYQSMPRQSRQATHLRIAQTLENDYLDVATTQPELLAQHFTAAGESRRAIEYWSKAGQRAASRSANQEAAAHFHSGLQLLPALPNDIYRDQLESSLQLQLGTVLVATHGYGSSAAGQAYTRALELCRSHGDSNGEYRALWGMWLTSSSRVGHAHSLELANDLLRLAMRSGDILHLQSAHHALGNSSLMTGNPEASRQHLQQSIALYHPAYHSAMVEQYGENICTSSLALLSCTLWLLGHPEQAEDASQRAIAMARQLAHPYSLGYALCVSAIFTRWMGQVEATTMLAEEAMVLSHQHGLPFWLGMGSSSHGWALAMQGKPEGIEQMRQCMAAIDTVMSGAKILFLAPLCEALVHLEKTDEALSSLEEAIRTADAKNDHFFASEFYRLKGECLLKISSRNAKEARANFELALDISRRQGEKPLELRALSSLEALARHDEQTQARRLLCQIQEKCP